IEAVHEASGAGRDSAAAERFLASAQRREVRPRARTPLEKHSFGARQLPDSFHVVVDRIDEARRALRLWLHAHVEPHRRIEGHLLLDQQVRQLIAEGVPRQHVCKIPALFAPANDGIYHAPDQLPYRSFALGSPGLTMEILAGDDVRRRLRPALRYFHVFLAEDRPALLVPNQPRAFLPFDPVDRRLLHFGTIPL